MKIIFFLIAIGLLVCFLCVLFIFYITAKKVGLSRNRMKLVFENNEVHRCFAVVEQMVFNSKSDCVFYMVRLSDSNDKSLYKLTHDGDASWNPGASVFKIGDTVDVEYVVLENGTKFVRLCEKTYSKEYDHFTEE